MSWPVIPEGRWSIIVVDLDGVLARPVWPARHGIGDPIPEGVAMVRHYAAEGYGIMIWTSRPQVDEDAIWAWTQQHNLPVDFVLCGKPHAALYIDDRAWRPPWADPVDYPFDEAQDLLERFASQLAVVTADGQRKRAKGHKAPWYRDDGHKAAMWRHLLRWQEGQSADPDSGAHPLVHVAWRALALACIATQDVPEAHNEE